MKDCGWTGGQHPTRPQPAPVPTTSATFYTLPHIFQAHAKKVRKQPISGKTLAADLFQMGCSAALQATSSPYPSTPSGPLREAAASHKVLGSAPRE